MMDLMHVEKRHNDRLWIMHFGDLSNDAIDLCERYIRDYQAQFSDPPHRYLVYDVGMLKHISFTQYLRERLIAVGKDDHNSFGRVGVVMKAPAVLRYAFDLFIKFTGKRMQPDLETRMFDNSATAISWLEEIIP